MAGSHVLQSTLAGHAPQRNNQHQRRRDQRNTQAVRTMTPSPAPSLFHSIASCAPNSSLWLLARTAQLGGVLVRRVSATIKSQFTRSLCFLQYAVHFNPIYIMLPKVQHHAQKSSHEPPPTRSQASTEGADHLCCTRVICDITLDSSKRPVHFSVHVRLQLLHLARVTCDTRNKKRGAFQVQPSPGACDR